MKKLILGGIIGAGLMYLFDPRQGEDRRAELSSRVKRTREEADTRAHQAIDTGKSVVETGKSVVEQAKSVATDAHDRLDSTVSTIKRHSNGTTEEADAVTTKQD